jgi:hypothetical protein
MTRCPKCDFELPAGAAECPACGIVLSKYRDRAETPPAATGAAPPPSPGDHNPYAPPGAPLVDAGGELYRGEPAGAAGGITSATLQALEKTRPWLRFLVGYGFVLVALIFVGALAVLVGGIATGAGGETAALVIGYAVGYLFYALVILAILMPLRRSAQALRDIGGSDLSGALESFTVHQATFWRRTGILIAVGVAIMVVAVIVMMLAAAASLGS